MYEGAMPHNDTPGAENLATLKANKTKYMRKLQTFQSCKITLEFCVC